MSNRHREHKNYKKFLRKWCNTNSQRRAKKVRCIKIGKLMICLRERYVKEITFVLTKNYFFRNERQQNASEIHILTEMKEIFCWNLFKTFDELGS